MHDRNHWDKALIVTNDEGLSHYLSEAVIHHGLNPVVIRHNGELWETYLREQPVLVLFDGSDENSDDLNFLRNIRSKGGDELFLIICDDSHHQLIHDAIRLQVANFVSKPVPHQLIYTLLHKYREILTRKRTEVEVPNTMVHQEMELKIPNNFSLLKPTAHFLTDIASPYLPKQSVAAVCIGLYELLLNAIEHGNLEIEYETKRYWMVNNPERYFADLRSKCGIKPYSDRSVHISFRYHQNLCEWQISDEGKGFNPKSIPNPLDPANIEACSGRGILIARHQFDSLEYLKGGRTVRVRRMARP